MRKTMQVILLKDIPKLGRFGDVKEVSRGYAQNFLIPKGLVEEATPEAIAQAVSRKDQLAKTAEADLARAEKLVSRLEGQTVEISAKASDEGTLYAAITPSKVAAALQAKGFDVKKDQVNSSDIKEVGEYEVTINLDHGLEARLTLVIAAEK